MSDDDPSEATDPAPSETSGAGFVTFTYPDFWFFWLGRLTGTIAVNMQFVAISWVVYSITGRALDLGLIGLALFLPGLLFFLPAGAVADRYSRKWIMAWSNFAQGAGNALLLYFTLAGIRDFSLFFAVALLLGAGRTFSAPTGHAILANIVPARHFPNALAWSSSGFQICKIGGPALGGFVLIAGEDVVFAVITLTYALSGLCNLGIRASTKAKNPEPLNLETLFAGFRFVWPRKIILGVISIDLFAVFLGGATALLPIYAKDILDVGEVGLGFLRSAPAVGAALCAFILTQRPVRRHAGYQMLVNVAIFGAATIVFGVSTHFWLTMAVLAVMGAADMISVFIRQSIIQLSTPDAMRGRVNAVNSIFVGASNELGEFESGVTAEWWGTVPAVVVGGIGTIVIALLWMRVFPDLRRIDRMDPASLARAAENVAGR